jgi:hypothetical protein
MGRPDVERRRLRSAQGQVEALIAINTALIEGEITPTQARLLAVSMGHLARLTLDLAELWRLHDREYTKGRT